MNKEEFSRQLLYVTDRINEVVEDAIHRGIHPLVIHMALVTQVESSKESSKETFGAYMTEETEKFVTKAKDFATGKSKS